MSSQALDEEVIFQVARKIADVDARSLYLQQVCGNNAALRDRVERLLHAHEHDEQFLKCCELDTADDSPLTEGPGTTIGRYRLMEQLAEGGMGVVFVAEQQRPLRRHVALKVIKPGLDSKAVIGRFEAERQALALMDHPNIARVLDAGTTDSGRPFFVMELVRGEPIHQFCDRHKYSVRQRLELFVSVCQAIQHAHQKGVIHRDVKPSNILVALHDVTPVVKVIDFGVAKALHQRLSERTVYTNFTQIVGTPLYMSPEQAELSGLDIDTRSDVYSLGVVLYELLTGSTPLARQDVERATFDDIRRMIRESEPPKPSTKISSLGAEADTVSQARQSDPRRLSQTIQGDLDWIIMRALEKDRTRRYETAAAMADDVERYLRDEPVVARPPSIAYRTRKFARRNRGLLLVSSVILLAMVVAFTATAVNLVHYRRIVAVLREKLVSEALGHAYNADVEKTEESIGQAISAGVSPAWVEIIRGQLCLYGDDLEQAQVHLKRATELEPNNLSAIALLGTSHIFQGRVTPFQETMGQLALLMDSSPATLSTEDLLFVGYSKMIAGDHTGFDLIDASIRQRDSPMARAIRASALGRRAVDQGNVTLIREALRDVTAARVFLPTNNFVSMIDISVHVQAFKLGLPEVDRERVLAVLKETEAIRNYGIGHAIRGHGYFELDLFMEAEHEYLEAAKDGDWTGPLTAMYVRMGRFSDAERFLLDKMTQTPSVLQRARLVWVRLLDRGDASTLDDLLEITRDPSTAYTDRAAVVTLLLLADRRPEAQSLALLSTSNPPNTVWVDLQYVAGHTTREQLLEKAAASRMAATQAYYTLAMDALSRGRVEEAKRLFTECINSGYMAFIHYWDAKAILQRLNQDEELVRRFSQRSS